MSSFRLSVRSVMLSLTTARAILLGVCLGGCSSQPNVSWDYNPAISLDNLRYYDWYPEKEQNDSGYELESLTQERIESAISMVLNAQGYREINSRRFNNHKVNADFYVHASYVIVPLIQSFPASYYYHLPTAPPNPIPVGGSLRNDNYEEGVLAIDMIDPKTNQVIWSGKSWARIHRFATPQQRVIKITNAVQKTLSGFPRPSHVRRYSHLDQISYQLAQNRYHPTSPSNSVQRIHSRY